MKAISRGGAIALFALASTQSFADEIVCPRPISEKICYTETDNHRKCGEKPDELKYIDLEGQVDHLYDVSPPIIKRALCSLAQLKVFEKSIERHGAFYRNNTHTVFLSIRSVIGYQDSYLSMVAFSNSLYNFNFDEETKESSQRRRNFYYLKDRFSLRFELQYLQPYDPKLNLSLASVMIHELAHMIEDHPDFNELPGVPPFDCGVADMRRNKEAIEAQADPVKGYFTHFPDQLVAGHDASLLPELFHSPYPSFYALMNDGEDFAEMVSDYLMLEHFGVNFRVLRGSEVLFDRQEQFEHPNIRPKLEVTKKFLAYHEMSADEREAFKQDRLHCRAEFAKLVG